jgi:hypothetical protein
MSDEIGKYISSYYNNNTIIANSITVVISNNNKERMLVLVRELLELRALNCDDAEMLMSCCEAL